MKTRPRVVHVAPYLPAAPRWDGSRRKVDRRRARRLPRGRGAHLGSRCSAATTERHRNLTVRRCAPLELAHTPLMPSCAGTAAPAAKHGGNLHAGVAFVRRWCGWPPDQARQLRAAFPPRRGRSGPGGVPAAVVQAARPEPHPSPGIPGSSRSRPPAPGTCPEPTVCQRPGSRPSRTVSTIPSAPSERLTPFSDHVLSGGCSSAGSRREERGAAHRGHGRDGAVGRIGDRRRR